MEQNENKQLQGDAYQVESLNLNEMDIEELERRLELASGMTLNVSSQIEVPPGGCSDNCSTNTW